MHFALLCSVAWEDGLFDDVLQEVESYLNKGKMGQDGVTGEGSMLQEPPNVVHQKKSAGKF